MNRRPAPIFGPNQIKEDLFEYRDEASDSDDSPYWGRYPWDGMATDDDLAYFLEGDRPPYKGYPPEVYPELYDTELINRVWEAHQEWEKIRRTVLFPEPNETINSTPQDRAVINVKVITEIL